MSLNLTPNQILALEINDPASKATTLGEYFAILAENAIRQEDGFTGKRPFGTSGWVISTIVHALILHKAIDGEIDDDGYVSDYSENQFAEVLDAVFDLLRNADYSTLSLPPVPKDWYLVALRTDKPHGAEMVDYYTDGLTEEDAKLTAEDYNKALDYTRWVAVHIPEVT